MGVVKFVLATTLLGVVVLAHSGTTRSAAVGLQEGPVRASLHPDLHNEAQSKSLRSTPKSVPAGSTPSFIADNGIVHDLLKNSSRLNKKLMNGNIQAPPRRGIMKGDIQAPPRRGIMKGDIQAPPRRGIMTKDHLNNFVEQKDKQNSQEAKREAELEEKVKSLTKERERIDSEHIRSNDKGRDDSTEA